MLKTMFRSFAPFLDADDGLDVGGTGVEAPEAADPVDEVGEEEQEVAEPVNETGKTDSDAAFAQMRRDLEAANRKALEAENQRAEYEQALGLFFDGENKVAQARAYHDNIPLEQVISDMENARREKDLETQLESIQKERDALLLENLKAQDLRELAAAGYKLESVDELGSDYFAYRGMGITPVQAYEGLQLKKGTKPKAMGEVKQATPERETFTRDEVERMSSAERVKNFDKIRKSMSTW